ncbi:MAG: hypothetical protein WCO98_13615 [bacterium]
MINHELQAIQAKHVNNLTRLYTGEKLLTAYSIVGTYAGYYSDCNDDMLAAWCAADLPVVIEGILRDGIDPVSFHPLVIEFNPLGVHYVDALFGAKVYRSDGQIWSELLPGGLADLQPIDINTAPIVQWTLKSIEKLLMEVPEQIHITCPIFSSPLNVAINLFGEGALMDLLEPDPTVLRGLDIITDSISGLHKLIMTSFPGNRVRFYCSSNRYAPDGIGHICGCSTQLLGQETYRNYFAPLDSRVLSTYPHGGTIHLCGHHAQHIPTWRNMPELRAVQLNDAATDEFPLYFNGLRTDQIIYLCPTEEMTIERILAISGGQRVVIQVQM